MRLFATALGLFILTGCGRGVTRYWEDGNYRVYERPASREIIMGHYMGDGAILGLSDPTVIAAGSNARHVVFQRQTAAGAIEYFYIEKSSSDAGEVQGPFSAEAFDRLTKQHSLPSFTWRLHRS